MRASTLPHLHRSADLCRGHGALLACKYLYTAPLPVWHAESCETFHPQEEVVAYVRRKSSAFTRGKSRFRGVSGHNGRWEARIGAFGGRKNVQYEWRLGSDFSMHDR